jgi:4-phospho-D-threonate 3-dehydrogenase / 4-phospho-D-erythronate 3-dehydrogenase
MSSKSLPRVGISIGDPNGIGVEVILKCFADKRMLSFCTPVIYANTAFISAQKKTLSIPIPIQGVQPGQSPLAGKVNVISVWKEPFEVAFGKETPEAGALALRSLEAATQALINDEVDVLVTAPINKHNIQQENFSFPGHTDYLAQKLEGDSLMFMVTDTLKVGLFTDHLPVKEVSDVITPELIKKKMTLVQKSLIQDFGIRKPKIAVLGINPHTGDNGVIGSEDDVVLRPTLAELSEQGMLVFGPFAADSFFGSNAYAQYDAIVASYHDQGLIPFKTLSFGEGVNFTAGLRKIRTSPDHGTAYEIAGKSLANEASFRAAVFSALSIYNKRQEHEEITQNVLKISAPKPREKNNLKL